MKRELKKRLRNYKTEINKTGKLLICTLGWAENKFSRKIIMLGYISLIGHKKNNNAKISAYFTKFLTQHISIEINKHTENHQIFVIFDIFLDYYET